MDSGYLVFPQIDPVMVKVFGLSIHWYGMMYLLAFVMAHLLANRAAAKPDSGWTKDQVSDLLFYGFFGVVVGGRLGYVFFYNYENQTQMLLNHAFLLLLISNTHPTF